MSCLHSNPALSPRLSSGRLEESLLVPTRVSRNDFEIVLQRWPQTRPVDVSVIYQSSFEETSMSRALNECDNKRKVLTWENFLPGHTLGPPVQGRKVPAGGWYSFSLPSTKFIHRSGRHTRESSPQYSGSE
jgi:hypothetical protein